MGICSSCLGLGRRQSQSDVSNSLKAAPKSYKHCANNPLQPSDSSHLLPDSYQPHYGALNADQRHNPQVDPEEIRRQRDALERLCVQTSEYVAFADTRREPITDHSCVAN